MSPLSALLGRELSLAWGRGGGPLFACAFYIGLATLLPLAEGPSPKVLAAVHDPLSIPCRAVSLTTAGLELAA